MHGIRVPMQDIRRHRDAWIGHGIPAAEIDRASEFQDRWGGLALPPAPFYEGGPRILDAGHPEGSETEGWLFPAGSGRVNSSTRDLEELRSGVHGLRIHDRT
ncbi:hypothetical protein [Streptomyces sp. NPDC059070]|uniref:hypothetical protein n=1 Tax=Streptomyces sp. NPDC059070 TaxID=3346713 RepID=UPI0036D7C79A